MKHILLLAAMLVCVWLGYAIGFHDGIDEERLKAKRDAALKLDRFIESQLKESD